MSAKQPATTKSGPGRFHKSGHQKATPVKSHGAPAGFVIHKASNAKRNRRTVIEAVGGVRQYKRMVYAERGLVYTAGNDCA